MTPQIHKHYFRLQSGTDTILNRVGSLPATTYFRPPRDGKWSISQILTHLLTSERLTLAYMQNKAKAPASDLNDSGLGSDFRFTVLHLSQLVSLRYKAPKVVIENTPEPLAFGDLVRQWEESRNLLHRFLVALPEAYVNKQLFKHPYAGRLSVVHALRFMLLHLEHHSPQIFAIIEAKK